MTRQHHGHQHHGKPEFVPDKAQARKGIGCKGTGAGVNHRARNADNKGINKESLKGNNADSFPTLDVVLYGPYFGQEAWIAEYLGALLEGRHNKPKNRIKHGETNYDDKDMGN